VNDLSVDDFFKGNFRQAQVALQSLQAVKGLTGFDFFVTVVGGGITGQAEAIRHGVARALSKWDGKIKIQMRKEGYLTRDPRAVERKKSGQPKARKRFQYSKR
jgi:small subunit ribosomal protein S9